MTEIDVMTEGEVEVVAAATEGNGADRMKGHLGRVLTIIRGLEGFSRYSLHFMYNHSSVIVCVFEYDWEYWANGDRTLECMITSTDFCIYN